MPKISGFDMLDILRSTPETQNIKVIMMTALSSEDQRVRGESLGADRYLVKSQVGIEDVVNVVHDVLGDRAADGTINPSTPANDAAMPVVAETVIEVPTTPSSVAMPQTPVAPTPTMPAPAPVPPAQPTAAPVQPVEAATNPAMPVSPVDGAAGTVSPMA